MSSETEIRPFHVEVSDETLADLRRRIAETRWPSKELVGDTSQAYSRPRCRHSPPTGRLITTGAGARRR